VTLPSVRPTLLGVITARAGSKGIPGKNTKLLAGQPLIAHTINAARRAGVFDRLIVSTDDEQAAAVARSLGCEVPFMRPSELCQDDTPHLPVMQHAVHWLEQREQYRPAWVMILMPTSPFRRPSDIVESFDLALSSGADSVVSVTEMPAHFHPQRALAIDARGRARLFVGDRAVRQRPMRRQDMPAAWVFNGAIYLFQTRLLFDRVEPSLYGDDVAAYVMPAPYGHNLDDPEDWHVAERILPSLA
jgi:CMP-N,N'-diacetyllegionaminic acid synthase